MPLRVCSASRATERGRVTHLAVDLFNLAQRQRPASVVAHRIEAEHASLVANEREVAALRQGGCATALDV